MNANYCGITPPAPAPKPRDRTAVAGDLRRAAWHLGQVAEDLEKRPTEGVMNEADLLGYGIGRLLVELRQSPR